MILKKNKIQRNEEKLRIKSSRFGVMRNPRLRKTEN
jgi:hypothetical protein